MSLDITVIGSTNVDLVVRVERFPQPGETLTALEYSRGPGGKGANQALAAARAGGDVRFVGAVGGDELAEVALSLLKRSGMNLESVAARDELPTGTAHITVDGAGENTIIVDAGANASVDDEVVRGLGPLEGIVLMQGETPASSLEAAALATQDAGGRFVLNLAPVIGVSPEVIRAADPLIVNEHELRLVAKQLGVATDDRDEAVEALLADGVRSLIVTLGVHGALVATADGRCDIDAVEVDVVDTTGAGDAFAGAFVAALAEGVSLVDAARFAAVFAGESVKHAGAQASYPKRLTVSSWRASAREDRSWL